LLAFLLAARKASLPSYSPTEHRQDCDRVLAPFLAHPELPFADVVRGADIAQAFRDADVHFGTSRTAVYTPPLTLWGWLSQGVHKEKACLAAALRIGVLLVALSRPPGDCDSGTYCRARAKVPAQVLQDLACQVGRRLERQVPAAWLWQGRHVHLADGFVVTMPDTPPNQRSYPQPASPKAGLGFPQMRLVLLVSLVTACVQALAYGPCQGKATGETALFRSLLAELVPGDVVVFDRYYCSYFLVAMLLRQGLDVVVRLHQRRASDFREGQRLGPDDHVVTWQRPQRPTWMSVAEYGTIPETITVREIRFQVAEPGFRVDRLTVVTTLLDATEYAKKDIADLYRERWQVELDIRSLKVGLQIDPLRCKAPFMVEKEVWANVLSYNLVRKVATQAALLHQQHPRALSFTASKQALEGAWQTLSRMSATEQLTLGRTLLRELSKQRVGERPNRCEPRAVKRRPKKQKLLTKPRAEAQAALLRARPGEGETGAARQRC
jgi:Transposase DDE domain